MEITKYEFEAFEKVRESGATNMFDTVKVAKLSGLEISEVKDIIKNYSKYQDKFK